ncbi:hypothetical protein [Aliivibrio kagoshimensis]|uniref:hypothetical protein n=1 Tax=Aliivibrio kagoshimensis TaxID=2910230 RepID=UPI003D0EBC28
MPQLAETIDSTRPAPESIAACKELFTQRHKRNQLKIAFNSLPVRSRGMICIAGGLSSQDSYRSFEEFDDLELQKIRRGLQELKGIIKRFDIKVGDVNKLKPSHFKA